MGIEWVPSHTTNLVGGIALTAFALLVALVPPRGRVQVGFGLFAGAFGVATAVANLAMMADPGAAWLAAVPSVSAVTTVAAMAGLLVLWRHMPAPLAADERPLLVPTVLLVLPFVVAGTAGLLNVERFALSSGPASSIVAASRLWWGFWAGLLALLALRYLHPRAHPEVRRQAPILSAGLVLYLGVNARWVVSSSPAMRVTGALVLGAVLVLAALWLVAAARGPHPRACRNVAWITLASALAGLVNEVAGGTRGPVGIDGVARLATVVILAVAILRHEALGVHGKLRFGISRSTVAAAFIAAFFVVSEGAESLFSEFAGNEALGVLGAGLLVFFLAPLQRAADRLAERAVPSTPVAATGAEASYRQAVRWALRGGGLTADEERALFVLAGDLGVSPRRAIELREEEESARRAPAVEAT